VAESASRAIRYHRAMPSLHGARDATPAGLRDAKQALRRRVLAARNAIPRDRHAQESARIADRLSRMPALASGATFCLTLPFGSEWDARLLVEHLLARGKTVAIPRVDADAKMLVLHAVRDLDADIVPGFRAIPEPRPSTPVIVPEVIDWVLVPGVAFDRRGGRIGYGGGYYDRLLPLCRHDAIRVAGAFDVQLVDEVPAAAHDARIDAIATADELISVERA
jgi:5-formyltetrahydrofolate cyclo-ligase